MTVGQKIAVLRTSSKISQEQLAEKLGVSRQSVSKWESDNSVPEIGKVVQLSQLFNVTTDELLKDDVLLAPSYTETLFKPKESFKYDGKYFGTDGFRGEANEVLTALHAYKIGRFLGWFYSSPLSGCKEQNHRTKVVIGKDTRRSSYMFEYAVVAGLTASGADAYMLHVITTPGVSYVAAKDKFDCGVMISASHNPYYDNGIKIVNSSGEKLDDYTVSLLEKYIDGDYSNFETENGDLPLSKREKIGSIVDYAAGRNRYVGFLISVAANSFKGLKIGLDCVNGASWNIAKSVFDALGASTYVINDSPDGVNINSTNISSLCKFVKENSLDAGFSFDGDADRCIAVDENGNIVNGDHILYILAKRLKDNSLLQGNTVVTTIMSNMGLYKALDNADIAYLTTTVGDRYVLECMTKNACFIGGEQTGHIIIRKYAATGDGILTAIMLTEELLDKKSTLGKLAADVKMYPQAIKNVTVQNKSSVVSDKRIIALIDEISNELGKEGRILMRESGTEPSVRIMVESTSQKLCDSNAARVCELIEKCGYTNNRK